MIGFMAGILGGVVLSIASLWLVWALARVRVGSSSVEQFSLWREVMRHPVAKEPQP